ncbi:sugar phosphate isomerase/epimerase family protein [Alteribacter populi]|uniref:sugar phosphate isomerase/epimerase family protein n=1 Tax=Alteribacter populi TaxID=2011011 RepID=UPI001FE1DC12|nr:sugar phosphate isomerase/epimerase [Alteribacter populi]
MIKVKFAAFSGAFREYSIHETMKTVKNLGFNGIEIACKEPHLSVKTTLPRVQEIKRLSTELELEIPALGGYMGKFSTSSDKECQQQLEDFKQILEWASILDADMIRIFQGGPNAFLAKDYHYMKAAFWLNECAVEAKKYNKNIVLEIHNISLVETVDNALRLLEMIDHENVGLIHDAGNMYITDTDYGRESVLKLGNDLFHVHVKDEKRVSDLSEPGSFINFTKHGEEKFTHCLLGNGEADHQPLFDTLKEVGYNQWLTLECSAPLSPIERLGHDLKKVKEMLSHN